MRRPLKIGALVASAVLVVAGVYYLTRPRTIPTTPPNGAPAVNSCWQVDADKAHQVFPWGGRPVDCAGRHTAEIYQVARVSADLIRQHDDASGQARAITDALMYASARRACVLTAAVHLGGNWHASRLEVIANWIKPADDGFFACAVAETAGPGRQPLVPREGSLLDALKDGDSGPLAIACVRRDGGTALTYVTCEAPHDGEYVGTYTITPLDAPFDANAVPKVATKGCTDLGLTYLGLPADGSRADLSPGYVGPKTQDDWLGSDQTYSCYLMINGETKLTRSIKGLGARPLG